jgi:hypothetical protein
VKVSGLKKLVEQAYEMGRKQEKQTSKVMDDIFRNAGMR